MADPTENPSTNNGTVSWSQVVQKYRPVDPPSKKETLKRHTETGEQDGSSEFILSKANKKKLRAAAKKEKKQKEKALKEALESAHSPNPSPSKKPKRPEILLTDFLQLKNPRPALKAFSRPPVNTNVIHGSLSIAKKNDLDASAPRTIRGKERESPKKKRLSRLKKEILAQRKAKQDASGTGDKDDVETLEKGTEVSSVGSHTGEWESDAPSDKECPSSPEKCPSELAVTEGASGIVHHPEAVVRSSMLKTYDFSAFLDAEPFVPRAVCSKTSIAEESPPPLVTVPKSGSKSEMKRLVNDVMQKLVLYQDRSYQKDPVTFHRRFVCGFRDVSRYLEMHKVKLILLACNIENSPPLEETMKKVRTLAESGKIRLIETVSRHLLARACKKQNTVSIVGILDYDVAAAEVQKLLEFVDSQAGSS